MSRHSKNNTSLPFFTYHEKQQLQYGTQRKRLGRDSLRDFDACYLCLAKARDPLVCSRGHLACKECIYENILAQKKELNRLNDLHVSQVNEKRALENQKESLAHLEKLRQFERSQGLADVGTTNGNASTLSTNTSQPEGSNNKSLPSFWIPSLTPQVDKEKESIDPPPKRDVVCTASEDPHPISVKKLIPVKFHKSSATEYSCPSCLKTLSNAVPIVLSKNCGHAMCRPCFNRLFKDKVSTSTGKKEKLKCFVCNEKFYRDKDLIELESEGTGFVSKGGKVEVKKFDVAFQG